MTTSTQWQLAHAAAERYERIAVPTILGPYAKTLVDSAQLKLGDFVLDVGCGTGAAARYAAAQVGPSGRVIGLDVNAGMIAVAKELPPISGVGIEWREESAYGLSISDQTVDVVLCAQVLQFLDKPSVALAEIYRVLKPSGHFVMSAWSELDENPYFQATTYAIAQHLGPDKAQGLKAGSRLASAEKLRMLLSDAGFKAIEVHFVQRELALPNLSDFIPQHIGATPLAASFNTLTDVAKQTVVQDIITRLLPFQTPTGAAVPFRSFVAQGER